MPFSRLMQAMTRRDPTDGGRERIRRQITLGTLGIGTAMLLGVAFAQPAMWPRVLPALALLFSVTGVCEALARQGHPRFASWIFVLGLLASITMTATVSGGVVSPGIRSLLVLVLIAGVLLGERPAIGIAVLCAVIAFGFAIAGDAGLLPASTRQYSATSQAVLIVLYLGITVLLMRLLARSVQFSFEEEASARRAELQATTVLEAVLRASGVGVWHYDPQRDEYWGDERVHQLLGSQASPASRVPGATWRALVHPEDLPAVFDAISRASRSGDSIRRDVRLTSASGTPLFLEVTFSRANDTDHQGATVTGLVLDRTAEHAAGIAREVALAAVRERVKELTLLHTAARLLRHDQALDAALLGQLAGAIPSAFLHPDRTVVRIRCGPMHVCTPGWRDTHWQITTPFRPAFCQGEITIGYLDDLRADDPFLPEERELIVSLVEILESFLERDHAEHERVSLETQLRQSQKMEALGVLAGGIAHDFNNILSAIGGNVSLARVEARPGDPILSPLGEIERAFERARDLVRRILLFSRRQDAARTPIRVAPLVEEVAQLLRASAPAHVRILVEHGHDDPATLADENQLHQALVNLGTNAVFAIGDRGGTVTFSVDLAEQSSTAPVDAATLPPGRYVRISVRDTGAGIDAAIVDKLFEPFFTTKGSAGTGLGLAVVHGVMHAHDGAVTVASTVGTGTTFTLYFPVHAGIAAPAPASAQHLVRGQGQRILFVDDEEAIVVVTTRMLRAIGYTCDGFTDPISALHAFRTTPNAFAAVVTDLSMPLMRGDVLARELASIRPGVPVAISSGHGADQVQAGAAWGVARVIPKPVSLIELSEHIAELIGPP